MALDLTLDIQILQCSNIIINDTTGLYDALTNVGGWGAPNLARANIDDAVIEIIDKNTNVVLYTYDIKALIISQGVSAGDQLILVQSQLELPDGIYYVKMTVMEGVNEYTVMYKKYIYCDVECCVFNSWMSMESILCNPCNTNDLTQLRMKQNLYDAMKAAECLKDDCKYMLYLGRLERMCDSGESYNYVQPCNCN